MQPDPTTLRHELGILTEDEVAEVAGVAVQTLRNWRVQRTGPPFTKIGREPVYLRESLLAWLKRNEEPTQ